MKFNEVMDKLFSGTPVYCGSNKYTVEDKMLYRNGSPTFTIDFYEVASNNWSLNEESEIKSIDQIKSDIVELSKKEYTDIRDFIEKASDVISKSNGNFTYAQAIRSTYIETPDDMIAVLEDCLNYNVASKDKLIDYQVITLHSLRNMVIVYMFYKGDE